MRRCGLDPARGKHGRTKLLIARTGKDYLEAEEDEEVVGVEGGGD